MMRPSGKLAVFALVSLLDSACHRRQQLPAPPKLPRTQTAAPTQTEPPRHTTPVGQTTPEPPPQQAQPPTQPPPEFRLGQALTPEELRANNALIDRHLQQTTQALLAIGWRAWGKYPEAW